MKALTVRNVNPSLARALERETARRGISLNQTVLDLLQQALGTDPGALRSNGLRGLAGTWSDEERVEFEAATASFEQLETELWP